MVVFQVLSWEAKDTEEGDEYQINIFGRTKAGASVCVTTSFAPYFFVKLFRNAKPPDIFKNIKNVFSGIVGYDLVKCKDVWGFQNNEYFTFMKLNFTTIAAMKKCDWALKNPMVLSTGGGAVRPKVFESNVEPLLRFMHRTGIQSTGWMDTGSGCSRSYLSHCDIDLFCNNWKSLKPVVERDDIAPFVIASFDIESYSSTGKFPEPTVEGDACFQIAFTLKRYGESEIFDKTCLCYKKTDTELEGCDIINYETEKDLLMGFSEYIRKHDIDALTGWNIFGFDLNYIYKRAILNNCPIEFYELGKLKKKVSNLVEKKLSSSALGDNLFKLLPMPGRFIFDLFHEIKRQHNLDSYSLNSVSQTFLGDQKIDMSPKEMFARFREEDPVKLREVAEYCIKDTILPHALMDKLCNFLNLVEMAKATWVPINYLSERGQQIKVFSQVAREARELGYMIPTIRWGSVSEAYEGATVLEAQTGAYYAPITGLDFASLYPSIMMAHNLCYSTLVMDPRYDNLPGVTYESFTIGDRTHKFAQEVPSLLPGILDRLKQYRKKAKKDMATSTGMMKNVYNGKQLAYKVSMNSIYGFTGASKGMLPCVAIAATVTCKGRSMIEETKNYVEKNYPGSVVRYGDTDSVMVEFNVEGLTGHDAIVKSWEMGEKAAAECTKLFKQPNDLELEKVYYPYFLYSKKRYAAKMWVQNKKGEIVFDSIDIKGLQVVRRDNTPYVRECCKEVLDIILESNNPGSAKECARRRAVELLDGQVPMEKLILSQKLADSYKSKNLAHVNVRDKIKRREPGSEPQSGDRVPYVLIMADSEKQYEKAEDPTWVKKKNLRLDYQYYFSNKFVTPVCDLLEPLVENPKEAIFGDLLRKQTKRIKGAATSKNIVEMFAKYEIKHKIDN
jgi:DNA polymerase delta subunit 1